MEFADFLLQAAREAGKKHIPHVGQIARLREALEWMEERKNDPFKIGDLVTPRHGLPVVNPGTPHLVVELGRRVDTSSGIGDNCFGKTADLHVASVSSDVVTTHWVESWMFERYDPAIHDKPMSQEDAKAEGASH